MRSVRSDPFGQASFRIGHASRCHWVAAAGAAFCMFLTVCASDRFGDTVSIVVVEASQYALELWWHLNGHGRCTSLQLRRHCWEEVTTAASIDRRMSLLLIIAAMGHCVARAAWAVTCFLCMLFGCIARSVYCTFTCRAQSKCFSNDDMLHDKLTIEGAGRVCFTKCTLEVAHEESYVNF